MFQAGAPLLQHAYDILPSLSESAGLAAGPTEGFAYAWHDAADAMARFIQLSVSTLRRSGGQSL